MTNGTRTMQRNYDLAGDTIFQDSGTGQTYTYTPNSVGQVYSVSTTQNGSTNTLSASALYTAWGALSARNGIETWGYDKRLRLTSHVTVHGATTEFSQSLTYQPNGNLKSSTEIAGTHSSSWSYTYDDLNRLSTALSSGLTPSEGCQETYDNWGNRTAQAGAAGGYVCTSVSPTANTNNQLSTLAYDAAGNTTYDGTNTYTYDAEGRITTVTAGGSPVAAYTYGPDGQRATKTVGSTTTYYSNDFDGALIARYESGTGITGVVPYNQEVWLNGQHLGTVPGVTNAFSRASVDQIGSERVELDPSGNIYGSMYYLPFGEGPQVIQGTPKTTTLFTGKERDAESGLDFLVSRYYSSNMGRFKSPDWSSNPISIPFARIDNPQTLNLYGYVGNNPLRYFDSYGHSKDCGGGGDPSVVCMVTSAWDKIKSWFGGGGGSGSGGGNSPAPAPAPDPGSGNVFLVTSTIRSVNRAPDYYSFSAQAGFANPTLSYVPKTNNFFFNFQAGAPKGIGVMGTAGWSLSRRPEDYPGSNAENYLGGRGVGGCGAFVVASCVGYSPGGGGWAFEAGLGTPGYSGTAGYALDWNSVVNGMWNAMPVEDPMAAMPSNGAVGIGSGLVYNPCMDGMDCH